MNVLLFISGGEIFLILIIILLLFGAKKIPDIARGLGKGLKEVRKATDDIKKEIRLGDSELTKNIKDIKNTATGIKKEIDKNTRNLIG